MFGSCFSCPCCGSGRAKEANDAFLCPGCNHRFAPARDHDGVNYSDKSDRNITSNSFTQAKFSDRASWLEQFLIPGARVLELGCAEGGLGEVLKRDFEITYVGVEPSRDRDRAMTILDNCYCSVEELLEHEAQSFDLVMLFHVLEHIPSVRPILEQISNLIGARGRLIIEVPNKSGSPLLLCDRNDEHLHQFCPASLAILLERSGFELLGLSTGHFESAAYSNSIRVVAQKSRTPDDQELRKAVIEAAGAEFSVYGIGGDFDKYIYRDINFYKINYFIDARDTYVCGVNTQKYSNVLHGREKILICSIRYEEEIRDRLLQGGHLSQDIVAISDVLRSVSVDKFEIKMTA